MLRVIQGNLGEIENFSENFFSKNLVGSEKVSNFALANGKQRQPLAKREQWNPGAVVQPVRIQACHAWGRGFESRPHRRGERRMSNCENFGSTFTHSFFVSFFSRRCHYYISHRWIRAVSRGSRKSMGIKNFKMLLSVIGVSMLKAWHCNFWGSSARCKTLASQWL